MGFPDSSVGKESVCNAGDPGSIPGLKRSAGEWIFLSLPLEGYPLQYSWASLVAQLVKNSPAMQETWFRSLLGRPPGEGNGYLLQYSCLENSMDYRPWGHRELDMTEHSDLKIKFTRLWIEILK